VTPDNFFTAKGGRGIGRGGIVGCRRMICAVIHGGNGGSYVIIYVKQKTKKEDLTNEYALED
jgi:hypothetical protein